MTRGQRRTRGQTGDASAPRPAWARDLPDFHNAPGHLVRRAKQLHDALWLRHVGEALTPLQYAVLTALVLEPGIDQGTLGERIALDKSTIGDLVVRLGRRSLITRNGDTKDGRRKILHVTEQGRVVLYEAAPGVVTLGREMLAPLTPSERREFLLLLDRLAYPTRVPAS